MELAANLQRLWQSRYTTVAVLAVYGVWLARGVVLGAGERLALDTTYPARASFVTTQQRWVTLQGRARLFTLRGGPRTATFVCPADLSVRCKDHPTAELHLQIEVEDVPPTPQPALVIATDIVTKQTHWVSDLRGWRTRVVLPLPVAQTNFHLESRPAGLAIRITELELVAPGTGAPFSAVPYWKPFLETSEFRIALGSGWWPRGARSRGAPTQPDDEPLGANEALYMRKDAYLKLEPKQPGPCWISLPCKKLVGDYPDPVLEIFAYDPPTAGPGRAPNAFEIAPFGEGVIQCSFSTDLGPANIVAIRHSGPLYAPRQLFGGNDARTISYGILFARMDWVGTK